MQFNEQMTTFFDEIARGIGIVIDWSQANVIPYIELLLNKFVLFATTIHLFAIVVAMLVILIYSITIAHFKRTKNILFFDDEESFKIATTVVLLIIAAVGIAVIVYNAYMIIKLTTFPELYMYDRFLGGTN